MPRKIPQPNGRGALNSGGTPGNKGGTGRPPIALKHLAKSILRDPAAQRELAEAAKDRTQHGYSAVIRTLFAYAIGVPKQQVELSGPNGGPIQSEVTDARGIIQQRLDRIADRLAERGRPAADACRN